MFSLHNNDGRRELHHKPVLSLTWVTVRCVLEKALGGIGRTHFFLAKSSEESLPRSGVE